MKQLLLIPLLFITVISFGQTNNYSIYFDENSSGVNFGNSSDYDMESTKTICFWAKDSSNRNIRRSFLYKGDCASSSCTDLHIWVNDSSNPNIIWTTGDDGGVCAAYPISFEADSMWHFYSFVYVQSTTSTGFKKIYFDGVLIDSCDFTDNASSNSYDLLAGDYNGQNSNPFASVDFMDDISIWNSALSSLEINNLMLCPPNGNETELISFWNFEEGTGTIVNDVTGNGHDGTIFNNALWSTDVPPYNCCTPNPITSQPTNQSTTIGNNATISFTDNLTGATYQWQIDAGTGYSNLSNAGQFSGTNTPTLTISSTTMSNNNTLYRCIVTESSNCMDTTDVSTLTVIDNTSINENGPSNLTIYPNPTSDQITIDIKGYNGPVHIEVYDLQGRLLETTTKTIVSLKKHAKGIYVLKISYGEVTEEVRVVRD